MANYTNLSIINKILLNKIKKMKQDHQQELKKKDNKFNKLKDIVIADGTEYVQCYNCDFVTNLVDAALWSINGGAVEAYCYECVHDDEGDGVKETSPVDICECCDTILKKGVDCIFQDRLGMTHCKRCIKVEWAYVNNRLILVDEDWGEHDFEMKDDVIDELNNFIKVQKHHNIKNFITATKIETYIY